MMKILWRQQQELLKKTPDCVKIVINNEDPTDIQADIEGPQGTPYEEGIFRVKLFIPPEFPIAAPKGYFLTKIFHPNVSEKGEICVNTLKRDWNPQNWSLYNLFEVIKCLLIIPFPQSSLNEEAGKMFMESYNDYFRTAKMYTQIHAIKKVQEPQNDNSIKDNNQNIMIDQNIQNIQNNNQINIVQNYENKIKKYSNNDIRRFNFNKSRSTNYNNFCFNNEGNLLNQNSSNENNLFSRKNSTRMINYQNKPSLNSLPLMNNNSLVNHNINNNMLYCGGSMSTNDIRKDKDEINKWVMRI